MKISAMILKLEGIQKTQTHPAVSGTGAARLLELPYNSRAWQLSSEESLNLV
jgi:hypothetical protein